MDARTIMTKSVVTASPSDTVGHALRTLEDQSIRHLPIVEDGRLIGMVSDRDLREYRLPLMDELDAPIALSPGFRWGTTLLPGTVITMEDLMAQVAITYPAVTLTEMDGAFLKRVLEYVADNLFNPDPYYQQGGDMVRSGGLQYSIVPLAQAGSRISELTLNGKPIDANKTYKVAGWASVQQVEGEPIWDVVARWLRAQGRVQGVRANQPEVMGLQNNQGIA